MGLFFVGKYKKREEIKEMSYLVVVAHPDDEVLGMGATIYKLAQQGKEVNVCIMCGQALARTFRPGDNELKEDMYNCMEMLGVNKIITGDFPNIKMNTSPHLELVQFIEKAIAETKADIVITHHPADLNNDHVQTSIACQAAVRLFQRRTEIKPIKELLYMEVLSSTEWGVNSSILDFRPNTYIEVGEEAVEIKIKALAQYRGVMRPFPHPRSREVIKGLAAYRGGMAGCNYAEAFENAFRRITI